METLTALHGRIKKILIRSANWIGDAVMTTPAMGAVRATFPEAEITVAANPVVAELLSPHPCCDRVLVFDKKGSHRGIPGLVHFAHGLSREKFDLAILFQNAMEAAVISLLAGVPLRAGYRTDCRGFLLTHGVPVGRSDRGMHHTAYYLHMLERLEIRGGSGSLSLACSEAENHWARTLLGEGSWVALNPGATYGSAKRWYPSRFAQVADRLMEELGARILLVGSAGETDIGEEIVRAVNGGILNMIGKTSVRQLMALLANCHLLITNDSGPMHIAAAFGVPIVALFGPTDHTTTSPLTDAWRLVRKPADCAPCLKRTCPTDHRCMEAIEAADVLRAVRDLVGKNT